MFRVLLFLLSYCALDAISYLRPVADVAITPWNPQYGLALAALLLRGPVALPWVIAAAVLSEWLVRGFPLPNLAAVAATWIPIFGYAALAMVLKKVEFDPRLHHRIDLTRFLFVVLPGTLCIDIVYMWAKSVLGYLAWRQLPSLLINNWIGDLIGVVLTCSLLLAWRKFRWRPQAVSQHSGAALTLLALTGLALFVVFRPKAAVSPQYFYLLFVPLIAGALIWGLRGATAVLQLIQLGVIGALVGWGHSAGEIADVQFLMLVLAVSGLYLGITVTEGRRVEATLSQREGDLHNALRLAAAGELASSLAHELNQPLTAVSTYSQACMALLKRPPEEQTRLASTLEKLAAEAQRAGRVVHRLRRFFRSGETHLERIGVADLIEQASEPLLRRLKTERVDSLSHIAPELPDVRVDRIQIEIVLHNLMSNAVDAIVEADSARRLLVVSAARENRYIRICVTDTGPGIDDSITPRLFESFATSKKNGMGLGLNISRSLVEAHGGRLELEESRPGRTRFCFTLPVPVDT